MNFFLIIFSFFLCFQLNAQSWNLIWSDEFNGAELDTAKWQHEVGTGTSNGLYGWGNSELQYYQPQNTVVSNGTAKIIALEEPAGIV